MVKKLIKPYFLIVLALLLIFLIPMQSVTQMRGQIVFIFSPVWNAVNGIKKWFSSSSANKTENEKILLENRLLKAEIERLNDLLMQEISLQTDLVQLSDLSNAYLDKEAFFQRRYEELKSVAELQLKAVPAEVIYRPQGQWNQTLWINIGSKTNEALGRAAIEKNSAVIKDSCVVGIVEKVMPHHSLVRLISDPKLKPSVRAARGFSLEHRILHHIDTLLRCLHGKSGYESLNQGLKSWKENIRYYKGGSLLAKGNLEGMIPGRKGCVLRGTGFNYDFSDNEGESKALLSKERSPLIQGGDLLVTTGMDGLFPAGLPVAEVIDIALLKEGAVTYEIEAIPSAGNLDDLQRVFVLPSLSCDPLFQEN